MNPRSPDDDGGLPLAAVLRIDELCDQFELAWRLGRRPNLDSYLEATEGLDRERLLSYLLDLELEFRQEQGERPDSATYLARFPDDAEVIDEAFARLQAS